MQGMEPHALEILLLHLNCFLKADLVGYDLELSKDGPVVRKCYVLNAVHKLQRYLLVIPLP